MYINELPNLIDSLDEIVAEEEAKFFNETESLELYDTCIHIMEEFIQQNPKLLSEPDFEEEFDENIENLMHSHFDFDVFYTEEAQEEMEEIIEHAKTDFYKTYMHPRSYPKSIILHEPDHKTIDEQIKYLLAQEQPTQRTKEWYEFRYNLITASNAWKAFESQATQNQLIYEKCQPLNTFTDCSELDNELLESDELSETNETNKVIVNDKKDIKMVNVNSTLHWGQKYEPVSVKIYEYVYNTTVSEFGCIKHNKYAFLGASPDGINTDSKSSRYGRMLEIKNIVNRDIDGIPKKEYWIQMQLQMEVCNLDECDFLETKFIEYESEQEFLNDTLDIMSTTEDGEEFIDNYVSIEKKMKGLILYFHTKEGSPLYIYKPLDLVHPEDVTEWIEENVDLYSGPQYNHTFMKFIYWKLQHISCVLVCRNKYWFEHCIEDLQNIWSIIEKERVTGYEHRAPNKKVKKDMNIMDLQLNFNESGTTCNKSNCLLSFNKDTGKMSILNKFNVIKND